MILNITIGTHYIHAAIFDGSKITLIPKSYGQGDLFHSCVYLDESGELLFGEEAESQRHCDPTRYRRELKQYLGQDTPMMLGDRTIMTEELFVALFKYLKSEAEKAIAKEVETIIIALCATDGEYRQSVIEKVAKNAGFSRVTMISEAIASAHYYEYESRDSFSEGDIILVYDLGGSIFSATLIQKKEQTFKLLAQSIVDNNLGGANFDRLIYQDFIDKHGEDLGDILERQDREAYKTRLEIANQCRDIKHYLSQKTKYQGAIKDYADYILSRQEFESTISPKVRETCELCQQLIQDNISDSEELSQVLMIGGSSHIPYIEKSLERELSANIKKVNRPDLAGCLGAKISFETQNMTLQSSKESKPNRVKDPPKVKPKNTQSSDSSDPFNWFNQKSTYSKTKNNQTQDWFS